MDEGESNQEKKKHIQTLRDAFAARNNFLVYGESVFIVAWMISHEELKRQRHEITLSNGGLLVIKEWLD